MIRTIAPKWFHCWNVAIITRIHPTITLYRLVSLRSCVACAEGVQHFFISEISTDNIFAMAPEWIVYLHTAQTQTNLHLLKYGARTQCHKLRFSFTLVMMMMIMIWKTNNGFLFVGVLFSDRSFYFVSRGWWHLKL